MTTLRQKIGQMLIIGFSGCEIDQDSPVVKWLQNDGLGGVLLFDYDFSAKCYGKNLRTQSQIKCLTDDLKNYAAQNNGDALPLFVALDYEGGAVDRLSKIDGCMRTIKASEQALLSDEALFQQAHQMAVSLKDLGFNLNFAPVVDLNLNEKQGIIGREGRSFSSEPEVVARATKCFVNAFYQQQIACAYKHFPGHGSAAGDTHEGFVDVTDSFQKKELLPYSILVSDKTLPPVMIMTAHVINRQLDPSGMPATLSYPILTELLRQKIGFNDIIVSDDLQMQAISNHFSLEDSLRLTINAGADMVIFGNQLGTTSATEVIDLIENLVTSGAIEASRIEEAYQRISRFKHAICDL